MKMKLQSAYIYGKVQNPFSGDIFIIADNSLCEEWSSFIRRDNGVVKIDVPKSLG